MKAIDFACRLLRSLSEEPHTESMQRVLLGLAAGLETSADIAGTLGLTVSTCTICLRRLKAEELVTDICGDWCYYRLTAKGKQLVASIFSFLPAPH
ncbi:MAG: hypothetical protein E7031_03865 [Akkermansiaceae bacterium]|nr:hypothetical protein [Akkermansiaceae bacterium]